MREEPSSPGLEAKLSDTEHRFALPRAEASAAEAARAQAASQQCLDTGASAETVCWEASNPTPF